MKTIALASATTLAFAGAAFAVTITIDTFETTQGPLFDPELVLGLPNTDTQTAPAGSIGDRTLTVTSTSGAFTNGRINFMDSGTLEVANDNGAQGIVSLSYDLGGTDLTMGGVLDTIVVGVESIDLSGLFTVDIDGVSANAGISTTGNLNFALSDFTGADLSDVETLSFIVGSNGVDALDSSFTFIGVDDLEPNPVAPPPPAPSVVPLPAGGLLLLTGFAGFAFMRRKS